MTLGELGRVAATLRQVLRAAVPQSGQAVVASESGEGEQGATAAVPRGGEGEERPNGCEFVEDYGAENENKEFDPVVDIHEPHRDGGWCPGPVGQGSVNVRAAASSSWSKESSCDELTAQEIASLNRVSNEVLFFKEQSLHRRLNNEKSRIDAQFQLKRKRAFRKLRAEVFQSVKTQIIDARTWPARKKSGLE